MADTTGTCGSYTPPTTVLPGGSIAIGTPIICLPVDDMVRRLSDPVQLDGSGEPEPAIREIVRRYYRAHFGQTESDRLTDAYFEKLATNLKGIVAGVSIWPVATSDTTVRS